MSFNVLFFKCAIIKINILLRSYYCLMVLSTPAEPIKSVLQMEGSTIQSFSKHSERNTQACIPDSPLGLGHAMSAPLCLQINFPKLFCLIVPSPWEDSPPRIKTAMAFDACALHGRMQKRPGN